MTQDEIKWLIMFLERSVPRGEAETVTLVKLVTKLRQSLRHSSDTGQVHSMID